MLISFIDRKRINRCNRKERNERVRRDYNCVHFFSSHVPWPQCRTGLAQCQKYWPRFSGSEHIFLAIRKLQLHVGISFQSACLVHSEIRRILSGAGAGAAGRGARRSRCSGARRSGPRRGGAGWVGGGRIGARWAGVGRWVIVGPAGWAGGDRAGAGGGEERWDGEARGEDGLAGGDGDGRNSSLPKWWAFLFLVDCCRLLTLLGGFLGRMSEVLLIDGA